mmetsp:Transcript_102154/g.284462  ORF Transcript_102154/g.284462 Transcript_102154/m.284462 type:complete len:82 (-) Transcript_102154:50-295(-)
MTPLLYHGRTQAAWCHRVVLSVRPTNERSWSALLRDISGSVRTAPELVRQGDRYVPEDQLPSIVSSNARGQALMPRIVLQP